MRKHTDYALARRALLEHAGRPLRSPEVHLRRHNRTEEPEEQIEKMNPDVGDDAARSILGLLAGCVVGSAFWRKSSTR